VKTGPITLLELAELPVTKVEALARHQRKVEGVGEMGIETVLDLLTTYPRRYIDRTQTRRIAELAEGEEALIVATVSVINSRRTQGRPPKALVTARVRDDSGSLKLTFFNQAWRERQLPVGTEVMLFGKVDSFRGERQLTNPVVDLVGDQTGRIVAVYPQSEKHRITTSELSSWVAAALRKTEPRSLAEPLPQWVLDRFDFIDRSAAFQGVHLPDSFGELSAARKRLVFDELLRLQLALVLHKRALEREAKGIAHDTSGDLVRRFHERLPFVLTEGQRQAIEEISVDLAAPHPMHRLLQGDVGAGKTIVAVSALLVAVQGGHQGAFMAPTEVLAEQHHSALRALLEGFELGDAGASLFGARPLKVDLLTNRTPAADRRRLAADLVAGTVDIVVGTHALIQDAVAFKSLGVVVIDEQHRFGVEQRAALRDKAGEAVPDVLVMTATPIPRTAAMTVYGDLDVSELKEKPGDRLPIVTAWEEVPDGELALDGLPVWDRVRDEVAAGHQAYVVCPLIEDSDKLEATSAEATFDELDAGPLAGLRLGLLHGRLKPAGKEAVMARFRDGGLDVLVATTVIEVGVDVPNATVMVILSADRFGIAQLHQLRGRVGRGADQSYCFLVGNEDPPPGKEGRLAAMVRTTDGFELAEVDLDLRGEGSILGERQKGRSDLKLASLRRDRQWVASAREVAIELVDADPHLAGHPALLEEVGVFLDEEDREFLMKG
jgi:ATP-dependent DNA helicase RecG